MYQEDWEYLPREKEIFFGWISGIEISAGCSTLILIRAVEHPVMIKRRSGNLKVEKKLEFIGFGKGNHLLSQMISGLL